MVGIGTLLALAVTATGWPAGAASTCCGNRWFLRFAVVAGPLAVVALEAGWVATEVGRQPWTVFGVLRTTDAAAGNAGLWWSFTGVASSTPA